MDFTGMNTLLSTVKCNAYDIRPTLLRDGGGNGEDSLHDCFQMYRLRPMDIAPVLVLWISVASSSYCGTTTAGFR